MDSHQRKTVSGKPGDPFRATMATYGSSIIFLFIFLTILVLYGSNQRANGAFGLTGYLIICGMYVAVMKILEESRDESLARKTRADSIETAKEGLGEVLPVPPVANFPIHGHDPENERTGHLFVTPNGREFRPASAEMN